MEFFLFVFTVAVIWRLGNQVVQRQRVALLALHLQPLRVEPLMGTVMDGYLRALGEQDPQRQAQLWSALENAEAEIEHQLQRLAESVAKLPAQQARISTLPLAVPGIEPLLSNRMSFDLRTALALHAQGVARVRALPDLSRRDRAFMLTAELLLMQHTCHWFCKSKWVASARLLAAHKTSYEQVLAAVSPETRRAYQRLLQGGWDALD